MAVIKLQAARGRSP